MNSIQLLKAFGGIDDECAELADPQPEHKKSPIRYAITAVAACTAIVLAAGMAWMLRSAAPKADNSIELNQGPINMNDSSSTVSEDSSSTVSENSSSNDASNDSSTDSSENDIFDEPAPPMTWDERVLEQKFIEMDFNGSTYKSNESNLIYVYDMTLLAEDNIGEKLGDAAPKGYDTYTDTSYETDAEVYRINSISPEFAVAVRFYDSDKIVLFENYDYSPDVLEDNIIDMDLRENVQFRKAIYYYINQDNELMSVWYSDFDDKFVWDTLLRDTSVKTEDKDISVLLSTSEMLTHENYYQMIVETEVPVLEKKYSIYVNSEGYLSFQGKTYFIGKDKADEFADLVTENCRIEFSFSSPV